MQISVIIRTRNESQWIGHCIQSLIDNFNKPEIVVIDNNSNDSQIVSFKRKYRKCKWIINKKNIGFARACNQGSKIAKYDHYIFLNPDTELDKNCLIKLKSKIDIYPNSILSISQKDSNGNKKFPYGHFLSIKTFNGFSRFIFRLSNCENRPKNNEKPWIEPDWVSGSFLCISRKNFTNLNGWDEDYWMYYEDMDLCKRAKNIGLRVILINSISCTHHHGKSSRINLETTIKTKTHLIKSGILFIDKHYEGIYQKFLKIMFVSSIIFELILLYPFSKQKRLILNNLIFNFRVKEF